MYGKYIALYAAELIKSGQPTGAMKVFIKHGTPVKDKVLNIYRHLATESFNNDPPADPDAAYANFGTLRKVLYKVVESLKQAGSEHQLEFDNLLLISHYYATRSAMQSIGGLETHIAKVTYSSYRSVTELQSIKTVIF